MSWKQICSVLGSLLFGISMQAQTVPARLSQKIQAVLQEPGMKHAVVALSVLDGVTGKPVFEYNEQMGLAPASTMKVLTAMAALETLGPDYRFETRLDFRGEIRAGILNGDLLIRGGGDPSLGSWRYAATKEEVFWESWIKALKAKGIKKITGNILLNEAEPDLERIPDGWIWQDIGNYYGAGAGILNWRENQYDVILAAGQKTGDPVRIIRTWPELYGVQLRSALKTGPKGSGDNAYIYLAPGSSQGVIRGTIPLGEQAFSIAGSMPDPSSQFIATFKKQLSDAGIAVANETGVAAAGQSVSLIRSESPRLDSLVYWFIRKSINLYGESMIKELARKAGKTPSTAEGVEQLVAFWKAKNIEPGAIQLMDGSGLSPQNRVSVNALATALYWSTKQNWYRQFYESFPVYNGMKLKSGSINGARAYTGFHSSADGKKYIVAILVNNYSGSGTAAVRSLYSVLDVLK
jgi:D-alanyl-D-alanine carboxypeptidase/D-alanyl-D-alanine-endopeptidase (penicillin-binding protein 4)